MTTPRVLAIAGSDSGGGAGIQADLKAFARCGAHGMTAISAITVQNTLEVRSVHPVAPQTIYDQVEVVVQDIGIDAVKIGMLGTVEVVETVARALDLVDEVPIVLDPVMVAESGAVLLPADAVDALRSLLVPRARVVTPNLAEARVLASAPEDHDGSQLARTVHSLGPGAVVVTGGHAERAVDCFFDGEQAAELAGMRHPDGATHGSGCTHSSALAAHLAQGSTPLEAARRAKDIAAEAVRNGLSDIGGGAGPVDVLDLGARVPAQP